MRSRIRHRSTPSELLWALVLLAFILAGSFALADVIHPNQPSTVALEPVRVDVNLQYSNLQLGTNHSNAKEPPGLSTNVIRTVIRFGSNATLEVAIIWDRLTQKLYVDQNRNLDLTDDPGGVFIGKAAGGQRQQFTNVFLPLPSVRGVFDQCSDITFDVDQRSGRVSAWQELRTMWQSKAEWAGRAWQVAMVDKFDSPANTTNGYFLIRPWDMRTNRFWLAPGAGPVPMPDRLFWIDRAFALECQQAKAGDRTSRALVFRPQDTPMVDVKLRGEFLDFAMLWSSNGFTAVVSGPAGARRMPAGTYEFTSARLKVGNVEATRVADAPAVLQVAAGTELRLGGPLTNTIDMSRSRRDLVLSYRLLGIDGRSYALVNADRSKPPEFVLYRGQKRILSGKLEYG